MSTNHAEAYLRRKQKNLNYFKAHLPRVYQKLADRVLTRAELVVTPGAKDVDMVVDGKSCYRGLAKEYSVEEALKFLRNNPSDKPVKTHPPEPVESFKTQRLSSSALRQIIEVAPVHRQDYEGYFRSGNFFPAIVFLGCGLGYHIETLVERATIVNAYVVERDADKFALSLFTVDWSKICSRFHKNGYSINFVIGFEGDGMSLNERLWQNLKNAVPFFPFQTLVYNHLADVGLAKTAMEVGRDAVTLAAHMTSYDDQLIRLQNTSFNARSGMTYICKRDHAQTNYPVVVVGSGPSIDHRIESLKKIRDKVIVLSAGTGIRALLVAGIEPDCHVELDPAYLVYEAHADIGGESLKNIPLLTVNEVNPHVPTLFGKTRYYFKSDNAVAKLLGVSDAGFSNCNPTCTNAALALSYSLGFRKIYLFGTDYGFDDENHDHARHSVWGTDTNSEFSQNLRARAKENKRDTFQVEGVTGGTVYTRADYYTAKRSVEQFLVDLSARSPELEVYNCADGARIECATWLPEDEFARLVKQHGTGFVNDLEQRLESVEKYLDPEVFEQTLPELIKETQLEISAIVSRINKAKLGGAKDLALLVNEIRLMVMHESPRKGTAQVTAARLMMKQLLRGTVLQLLHVVLSYTLACKDGQARQKFMGLWRKNALELFGKLPVHLERVLYDQRSMAENPWSKASVSAPEPEVGGW